MLFSKRCAVDIAWKETTADFLWTTGFSGLGNWSDWKVFSTARKPLSYVVIENFMDWFCQENRGYAPGGRPCGVYP